MYLGHMPYPPSNIWPNPTVKDGLNASRNSTPSNIDPSCKPEPNVTAKSYDLPHTLSFGEGSNCPLTPRAGVPNPSFNNIRNSGGGGKWGVRTETSTNQQREPPSQCMERFDANIYSCSRTCRDRESERAIGTFYKSDTGAAASSHSYVSPCRRLRDRLCPGVDGSTQLKRRFPRPPLTAYHVQGSRDRYS